MSESIKTTELTEVTSVANTDTIVVDVSAGTRKVTKENLLKEINTEISTLKNSVSDGKTRVASAITAKGVATSATDTFATMATNIGNIQTGGTAPDRGTSQYAEGVFWGEDLGVSIPYGNYSKFPDGGNPFAVVPKEWLGNALASDVAAGKTFTSAAGLTVVGTASGGGEESSAVGIHNNTYSGSNGNYTYTLPSAFNRAIVIVGAGINTAVAYGTNPTLTTNGGILKQLTSEYTLWNNSIGCSVGIWELTNAPAGTVLTAKVSTSSSSGGYAPYIYVIRV